MKLEDFNIGDRVEMIQGGTEVPVGSIGTVDHFSSKLVRVLWDFNGKILGYYPERLKIIGKTNKEEKTMSNNKWSFSICSSTMIDFQKVAECLSYSNPIAFVTVKPRKAGVVDELYILIHESLVEKANNCADTAAKSELDRLIQQRCISYISPASCSILKAPTIVKVPQNGGDPYKTADISMKAQVQKLAKRIKMSPFRQAVRFSADVEVLLPKVN